MPDDPVIFETKDTITVYCNQALMSLSYNDIRVYLLELSPSELVLNPTSQQLIEKAPRADSKFCLAVSPEFARSLAKSLLDTVAKYEAVFGALRPEPTKEQVSAAVELK